MISIMTTEWPQFHVTRYCYVADLILARTQMEPQQQQRVGQQNSHLQET